MQPRMAVCMEERRLRVRNNGAESEIEPDRIHPVHNSRREGVAGQNAERRRKNKTGRVVLGRQEEAFVGLPDDGGHLGHFRIMGDHDDRLAAVAVQVAQDRQDLLRIRGNIRYKEERNRGDNGHDHSART